jgi:hypothetical protein
MGAMTVAQVLKHFDVTPNAYLFGRRDSDTPFALIDNEAVWNSAPRFAPSILRSVVTELANSGYLDSKIIETEQSAKIIFTRSEKDRRI